MYSQPHSSVSLYDREEENTQAHTIKLKIETHPFMNYDRALSCTFWNANWSNIVSTPKFLIHEVSVLLYFAIKEDLCLNVLINNIEAIFKKRFQTDQDIFNKLLYYTRVFIRILSYKFFHNCEDTDIKLYQRDSLMFEKLFLNDNIRNANVVLAEMVNSAGFDFGSRLALASYAVIHNVSTRKFKQYVTKTLNRRRNEINIKVKDAFIRSISTKVINNTKYLTFNLHAEVLKYYNTVNWIFNQHGLVSYMK